MEDIYKNPEIKKFLLNYEPNSWKKVVGQLALLGIKYIKSKPPKANGYTLQELINLNNIEQPKKVIPQIKQNNIKQEKSKNGYGNKTISTINKEKAKLFMENKSKINNQRSKTKEKNVTPVMKPKLKKTLENINNMKNINNYDKRIQEESKPNKIDINPQAQEQINNKNINNDELLHQPAENKNIPNENMNKPNSQKQPEEEKTETYAKVSENKMLPLQEPKYDMNNQNSNSLYQSKLESSQDKAFNPNYHITARSLSPTYTYESVNTENNYYDNNHKYCGSNLERSLEDSRAFRFRILQDLNYDYTRPDLEEIITSRYSKPCYTYQLNNNYY